ncbi:UDP-N-acetylmuramoyl-L-alanyl-D-glutamate--2,6-diaminopimelate ligase [Tersicoccus sp. Bi-70]|uniref:UDP-N-acetylmuramoyl-L-alanyl-D-glutamate--2, 6-diaminopimelate ligase n=1 Tax=Tersicoccus sp. Bi-70 TaxID=1897634 RepID=UPI000977D967|nr:UDP-N-acetylmuramoyl-L-alanyl-D-glutamate--2,6-diaminopimelate ligase [Tersicoccus sp. Bi-70]OMH33208.1 UDP-N-acetylmuramoyl-L-alanyl-D-glutamate--2,6-diaminopimelate ligase [Tersicoccus sp. Bi-70]
MPADHFASPDAARGPVAGHETAAADQPPAGPAALRPARPRAVPLSELRTLIGAETAPPATPATTSVPSVASGAAAGDELDPAVTGVSLNTSQALPGDLYAALPGAHRHGAEFVAAAVDAGAVAVLTDAAGAAFAARSGVTVPVLVHSQPRSVVGALSARVFGPAPEEPPLALYAVTGTNGKTTTTYLVNALLGAAGSRTGLIGTIEILAGRTPIPSVLTTPEAPQVHSVLALMREHGVDAAAMEVSSHALSYHRVDGIRFDVAGFTNLTQDHLDLHGSMGEYFAAKAQLFTPEHARRAVILADGEWGRAMAAHAAEQLGADAVTTLLVDDAAAPSTAGTDGTDGTTDLPGAVWRVTDLTRDGLGHRFTLSGPDGARLNARTGLPGGFNVANAALAVLMVHAGGMDLPTLQRLLDTTDALTPQVPGRMQVIGTAPHAIVDFAHNPDALVRALEATRPDGDGRLLIVFGATGDRDATKRPLMGEIAARLADVVIVTDDDPHDEDPAPIRSAVLDGVHRAVDAEGLATVVEEVHPRAEAIRRAVELARPQDSILVAGRGHEVWQEVKGVNLPLDDRQELAEALRTAGQHGQAPDAAADPDPRDGRHHEEGNTPA